jgi:hypothetical protein
MPVSLEIPDEVLSALKLPPRAVERELRKELAIHLVAEGLLPQGSVCWPQARTPTPSAADYSRREERGGQCKGTGCNLSRGHRLTTRPWWPRFAAVRALFW